MSCFILIRFLLEEITGKRNRLCFKNPIVYEDRLKQSVLCLTNAILNERGDALCSELLLSLTESLTQKNFSVESKKDNRLIKKAKEMLHTNLGNVLKLEEISSELHLSKFQFIRLFKSHTGITPYQYFLNCKIERAKQLIEETRDIYTTVAECDFVDLSHLNKHFKRVYGITAFDYMLHLNKA